MNNKNGVFAKFSVVKGLAEEARVGGPLGNVSARVTRIPLLVKG